MDEPSDQQLEIQFDADREERGLNPWRAQRQAAIQALARQLGLPLEHPVEVWLRNGIRLRGTLRLLEERLFVEEKRDFSLALTVDGVSFTAAEIESCVRTD